MKNIVFFLALFGIVNSVCPVGNYRSDRSRLEGSIKTNALGNGFLFTIGASACSKLAYTSGCKCFNVNSRLLPSMFRAAAIVPIATFFGGIFTMETFNSLRCFRNASSIAKNKLNRRNQRQLNENRLKQILKENPEIANNMDYL